MTRIKNTILAVLFLAIFLVVSSLIVPQLREAFVGIIGVAWITIKVFFLQDLIQDLIKKVILYVVIATLITGSCIGISRRKENKIWIAVGLIVDIAGLIALF